MVVEAEVDVDGPHAKRRSGEWKGEDTTEQEGKKVCDEAHAFRAG